MTLVKPYSSLTESGQGCEEAIAEWARGREQLGPFVGFTHRPLPNPYQNPNRNPYRNPFQNPDWNPSCGGGGFAKKATFWSQPTHPPTHLLTPPQPTPGRATQQWPGCEAGASQYAETQTTPCTALSKALPSNPSYPADNGWDHEDMPVADMWLLGECPHNLCALRARGGHSECPGFYPHPQKNGL